MSRFTHQLFSYLAPFVVLVLILLALPIVAPFVREYLVQLFEDGMPRSMTTETFEGFLKLTKILIWMSLVVVVVRFINSLIFHASRLRAGKTSSLLQNVFSITVYVVAFFVVFNSQYPKVDLAALFTTSAILGVILGLALQDTLGNLFSGLSMQADAPFVVGDVISIGERGAGVVENITWRGVKIRTFQNKLLIISNSVIGKEIIEVAPRMNLNARIVFFNTLITDSPAQTIHVAREAILEADNVSPKMRPIVRIKNLGESGLEWEIKYWLEDYARYNDTDALVRQLIWYAFQRNGITFNFPTRTLHMERRKTLAETRSEQTEIYARLSEIGIFLPLTDDETTKLAAAATRRVFAPNEVIIRAGDAGSTMFVINHGSVGIQISDAETSETRTLATLGAGRFFGEMALFTGEPRTATVIAMEETEVFEIGHDAIQNLFDCNPYLVETLSDSIAERRALLAAPNDIDAEQTIEERRAGIFSNIKRFFGISSQPV